MPLEGGEQQGDQWLPHSYNNITNISDTGELGYKGMLHKFFF